MRNDYPPSYNLFIQFPVRPNETSDAVLSKEGTLIQAGRERFQLEWLFQTKWNQVDDWLKKSDFGQWIDQMQGCQPEIGIRLR